MFLMVFLARRLNPFEGREVLQVKRFLSKFCLNCLNPFEGREVLQVLDDGHDVVRAVSIPLKAGRCCKALQDLGFTADQSQSL